MRSGRLGVIAILFCLAYSPMAHAQTTLTTLPDWNGSTSQGDWGVPDTSTYGQTFTTPTDNVLNDFTVYMSRYGGSGPINYQAYVYAWDGSKAAGPALFTSAVSSVDPGASFIPVTTNTGATTLTAGQVYVAFLSTSGLQAGRPNSRSQWGISNGNSNDYSGGDFVYYNTGDNFSLLTTNPWDYTGAGGAGSDTAFVMHFSSSAVPEPGSIALLTGLSLTGAAFLRRRKTARKAA